MGMPTITRRRAALYLAVLVVVLALGGRYLATRQSAAPAGGAGGSETAATISVAEADPPEVVVDVVGAVRSPGLYHLPEGSRVEDAITRAGGPTPRAAIQQINLAAPVVDGTQIVVPARLPPASRGAAVGEPTPGPQPAPQPVSLSTATLDELDGLPGVGPVTAQKIVEYREKHGPFRSVDDLDAIPGIGPARLAQLRELVVP